MSINDIKNIDNPDVDVKEITLKTASQDPPDSEPKINSPNPPE